MKPTILKAKPIFLLLVTLCVVAAGAGCDDDDNDNNDDDGEYTELEFFKFSDFGCENDNQWNLNSGYHNDNYVITSQEEFEEIVNMKCAVQIDFSNYTLLIGSKTFTTGASVFDEKVVANNYEIVYTVTFLPDESTVVLDVPYYVIIDNLSGKDIRIEEVIKESK